MEIADALLNQRLVAGVGNIYKSEVLFLCGVSPFAPVRDVRDDSLREILATARKHLQANVTDPKGGITTYRGLSPRQRARRVGAAVCLRPRAQAVPEVRNADSSEGAGAARAAHLLVPGLPGLTAVSGSSARAPRRARSHAGAAA